LASNHFLTIPARRTTTAAVTAAADDSCAEHHKDKSANLTGDNADEDRQLLADAAAVFHKPSHAATRRSADDQPHYY